MATFAVAGMKEYQTPDGYKTKGTNDLYAAMINFNDASTCAGTANNWGQILALSFNYEVDAALYVDQLSQNLVDDIFA